MTSSCSGISLSRPGSGPRYLCIHIQEVGLIRSCGSDDYAFTYFWLRSLGLSGMVIFNNPCSTREAICIFRFFDWLDIPNLSIISLAVRGTVQKFKISLTLPARMSSWLLFLVTLPFSWLLFLVALPFSWLLFLVTLPFSWLPLRQKVTMTSCRFSSLSSSISSSSSRTRVRPLPTPV